MTETDFADLGSGQDGGGERASRPQPAQQGPDQQKVRPSGASARNTKSPRRASQSSSGNQSTTRRRASIPPKSATQHDSTASSIRSTTSKKPDAEGSAFSAAEEEDGGATSGAGARRSSGSSTSISSPDWSSSSPYINPAGAPADVQPQDQDQQQQAQASQQVRDQHMDHEAADHDEGASSPATRMAEDEISSRSRRASAASMTPARRRSYLPGEQQAEEELLPSGKRRFSWRAGFGDVPQSRVLPVDNNQEREDRGLVDDFIMNRMPSVVPNILPAQETSQVAAVLSPGAGPSGRASDATGTGTAGAGPNQSHEGDADALGDSSRATAHVDDDIISGGTPAVAVRAGANESSSSTATQEITATTKDVTPRSGQTPSLELTLGNTERVIEGIRGMIGEDQRAAAALAAPQNSLSHEPPLYQQQHAPSTPIRGALALGHQHDGQADYTSRPRLRLSTPLTTESKKEQSLSGGGSPTSRRVSVPTSASGGRSSFLSPAADNEDDEAEKADVLNPLGGANMKARSSATRTRTSRVSTPSPGAGAVAAPGSAVQLELDPKSGRPVPVVVLTSPDGTSTSTPSNVARSAPTSQSSWSWTDKGTLAGGGPTNTAPADYLNFLHSGLASGAGPEQGFYETASRQSSTSLYLYHQQGTSSQAQLQPQGHQPHLQLPAHQGDGSMPNSMDRFDSRHNATAEEEQVSIYSARTRASPLADRSLTKIFQSEEERDDHEPASVGSDQMLSPEAPLTAEQLRALTPLHDQYSDAMMDKMQREQEERVEGRAQQQDHLGPLEGAGAARVGAGGQRVQVQPGTLLGPPRGGRASLISNISSTSVAATQQSKLAGAGGTTLSQQMLTRSVSRFLAGGGVASGAAHAISSTSAAPPARPPPEDWSSTTATTVVGGTGVLGPATNGTNSKTTETAASSTSASTALATSSAGAAPTASTGLGESVVASAASPGLEVGDALLHENSQKHPHPAPALLNAASILPYCSQNQHGASNFPSGPQTETPSTPGNDSSDSPTRRYGTTTNSTANVLHLPGGGAGAAQSDPPSPPPGVAGGGAFRTTPAATASPAIQQAGPSPSTATPPGTTPQETQSQTPFGPGSFVVHTTHGHAHLQQAAPAQHQPPLTHDPFAGYFAPQDDSQPNRPPATAPHPNTMLDDRVHPFEEFNSVLANMRGRVDSVYEESSAPPMWAAAPPVAPSGVSIIYGPGGAVGGGGPPGGGGEHRATASAGAYSFGFGMQHQAQQAGFQHGGPAAPQYEYNRFNSRQQPLQQPYPPPPEFGGQPTPGGASGRLPYAAFSNAAGGNIHPYAPPHQQQHPAGARQLSDIHEETPVQMLTPGVGVGRGSPSVEPQDHHAQVDRKSTRELIVEQVRAELQEQLLGNQKDFLRKIRDELDQKVFEKEKAIRDSASSGEEPEQLADRGNMKTNNDSVRNVAGSPRSGSSAAPAGGAGLGPAVAAPGGAGGDGGGDAGADGRKRARVQMLAELLEMDVGDICPTEYANKVKALETMMKSMANRQRTLLNQIRHVQAAAGTTAGDSAAGAATSDVGSSTSCSARGPGGAADDAVDQGKNSDPPSIANSALSVELTEGTSAPTSRVGGAGHPQAAGRGVPPHPAAGKNGKPSISERLAVQRQQRAMNNDEIKKRSTTTKMAGGGAAVAIGPPVGVSGRATGAIAKTSAQAAARKSVSLQDGRFRWLNDEAPARWGATEEGNVFWMAPSTGRDYWRSVFWQDDGVGNARHAFTRQKCDGEAYLIEVKGGFGGYCLDYLLRVNRTGGIGGADGGEQGEMAVGTASASSPEAMTEDGPCHVQILCLDTTVELTAAKVRSGLTPRGQPPASLDTRSASRKIAGVLDSSLDRDINSGELYDEAFLLKSGLNKAPVVPSYLLHRGESLYGSAAAAAPSASGLLSSGSGAPVAGVSLNSGSAASFPELDQGLFLKTTSVSHSQRTQGAGAASTPGSAQHQQPALERIDSAASEASASSSSAAGASAVGRTASMSVESQIGAKGSGARLSRSKSGNHPRGGQLASSASAPVAACSASAPLGGGSGNHTPSSSSPREQTRAAAVTRSTSAATDQQQVPSFPLRSRTISVPLQADNGGVETGKSNVLLARAPSSVSGTTAPPGMTIPTTSAPGPAPASVSFADVPAYKEQQASSSSTEELPPAVVQHLPRSASKGGLKSGLNVIADAASMMLKPTSTIASSMANNSAAAAVPPGLDEAVVESNSNTITSNQLSHQSQLVVLPSSALSERTASRMGAVWSKSEDAAATQPPGSVGAGSGGKGSGAGIVVPRSYLHSPPASSSSTIYCNNLESTIAGAGTGTSTSSLRPPGRRFRENDQAGLLVYISQTAWLSVALVMGKNDEPAHISVVSCNSGACDFSRHDYDLAVYRPRAKGAQLHHQPQPVGLQHQPRLGSGANGGGGWAPATPAASKNITCSTSSVGSAYNITAPMPTTSATTTASSSSNIPNPPGGLLSHAVTFRVEKRGTEFLVKAFDYREWQWVGLRFCHLYPEVLRVVGEEEDDEAKFGVFATTPDRYEEEQHLPGPDGVPCEMVARFHNFALDWS